MLQIMIGGDYDSSIVKISAHHDNAFTLLTVCLERNLKSRQKLIQSYVRRVFFFFLLCTNNLV